MIKRKKLVKAGLASIAGVSLLPTVFAEAAKPVAKKPNIIVILADDMGYSDVLCDDINTPNLDMMAKNGVTFTQFYNNAKCSPTRASLLTGSYNVRKDRNKPHLPTAMNNAGYLTGMVGKVHGHTTRGFTRDFTVLRGSFNFFNPEEPEAHNKKAGRKKKYKIQIDGKVDKNWKSPEGFYTTDNFTDYTMSYMDDAKKQGKPFFLYMAYNAPHWPLQAWPEDIAKYKGKYKKDFDLIRAARYKKLVESGVLPEKFKLSPRDEDLTAWNTLSDKEKDEFDTLLATHAAMVDRLDQNIGRLLKKIKDIGEEDNTLIMFLSDNGAASTMGGNKTTPEVPIGAKGSFAGIGLRGANLSCAPFRKVKTWDHEGGISTPLIAYWGGNIKDKGRIIDSPAHVIDILPTCLEVAGISQDSVTNAKGMNGISYYPLLKNKEWKGHSEIYWKYGLAKAVRQGDWKLVAHKKLSNGEWELYNMKEDRTELNNLASQNPEKVKELGLLWETWNKNCGEKK